MPSDDVDVQPVRDAGWSDPETPDPDPEVWKAVRTFVAGFAIGYALARLGGVDDET